MTANPTGTPPAAPGDIRKRRTRALIFDKALELAEKGELDGTTMKAFAEESTVSVNTIKGHSFRTIADIASALLSEAHGFGLEPSERARKHLDVTAHRSTTHRKQDQVQEIRHEVTRLTSPVERGTVKKPLDTVEELQSLYEKVRTAHPDQPTVLAEICDEISKIYRHHGGKPTSDDPDERTPDWEKVEEWTKIGLEHLESDRRGRSFDLGRRLASRASTAIRQTIITKTAKLDGQSTDDQRREVQLAVMPNLATLMTIKKQERDYALKLNQKVRAAAAEFHRARAEALISRSRRGEVDATIEMARSLDRHEDAIPIDILEMFLPRLCALQITYTDEITGDENAELDAIRPRLIDKIQVEAKQRAMQTLFALADFDRQPDPESGTPIENFHLTDLVLISTYGIGGKILLADHLRRIATSLDTAAPMYAEAELLNIGKPDLLSAARHFYESAPNGMSTLGVAAELTRRARDTLAKEGNAEVLEATEPTPWPILDGDGLNSALLDQFALGAVTGSRPKPEQAARLLAELRPFLDFLNSIVEGDIGTAEKSF